MQTEIFLARVLGIFFLFLGMAGIKRRHLFLKMIKEFTRDPLFIFFSGVFGLGFGSLLVVSYNVWTMQWTLVITLLGWFMLLGGIVRIYFPEYISKFAKKVLTHPQYERVIATIIVLIGIDLLYFGYFA